MSHPGARKGRSAAEAADLDLCGSMGVTVVLDERLILAGLAGSGQRLAVGAHRAVLDAGQAEFQRHVALEPEAERAVAALPVVEAGVGVDQADANEALIEAAPELYAVARAAEAMLIRQKWRPDPSSPEGALLLALRAVLAKSSKGHP